MGNPQKKHITLDLACRRYIARSPMAAADARILHEVPGDLEMSPACSDGTFWATGRM